MLKKRIIGVVNILNGWAVQSFGYKKYLPLGKAECLIENLDRWGADEILVQAIDRSKNNLGPDFELLEKIGKFGIGTPLIYGGGIRNEQDAHKVIQLGADRIVVDTLLHNNLKTVETISAQLGSQAVIASLPMSETNNQPCWYDYGSKSLDHQFENLCAFLNQGFASEVLLVDYLNEGGIHSFNEKLVSSAQVLKVPLILFGGITEIPQMKRLLSNSKVSAIACGNTLSYEELRIQKIKAGINLEYIRNPYYHEGI
jgi:cyclase